MKVLVLSPLFPTSLEPTKGNFIKSQLLALARRVDLHVVCPVPRYPPVKSIRSMNQRQGRLDPAFTVDGLTVTYIRYPTLPIVGRWVNWLLILISLLWNVRVSDYDAILSFWIYPDSLAAVIAGRLVHRPVVIGARGTDIHGLPHGLTLSPTQWLTRYALQKADGVLSVSEAMREQMIGWGIPAGKIRVILNGVDRTLFFPRPKAEVEAELGLPAGRTRILFVGWLEPHKGVADLVAAFARVRQQVSATLVLVGDGYGKAKIEAEVQRLGVEAQVLFTGHRPHHEMAAWLNASDILCLPSLNEGCPNVVLEALASGVPVVASAVGALPQIVREDAGLLVPPANIEALAAALVQLATRPLARDVIAVRNTRSWDDVAGEVFAELDGALHRYAGRHRGKTAASIPS